LVPGPAHLSSEKKSPASSRLAVAVAGNPFDSLPLERVVAPPLHQLQQSCIWQRRRYSVYGVVYNNKVYGRL